MRSITTRTAGFSIAADSSTWSSKRIRARWAGVSRTNLWSRRMRAKTSSSDAQVRLRRESGEGCVDVPILRRPRSRRRFRTRRISHTRPQDDRRGLEVHGTAGNFADEEPGDGGRWQAVLVSAARRSSAERNEVARVTGDAKFVRRIPQEIREWFGASAGSLGPVGVKNMRVLADNALKGRRNMIAGATRTIITCGTSRPAKTFRPSISICGRSRPGDAVSECGAALEIVKDRRDRAHLQARLQIFRIHGPSSAERRRRRNHAHHGLLWHRHRADSDVPRLSCTTTKMAWRCRRRSHPLRSWLRP